MVYTDLPKLRFPTTPLSRMVAPYFADRPPTLGVAARRGEQASAWTLSYRIPTQEGGPTPLTTRVSPTEGIRAEIDELIAGAQRGSLLEHFEEVARAAVRLVFQAALEEELTEFLGRERYASGAAQHEGSRNEYSPVSIKTTAGEVTPAVPQDPGHRRGLRLPVVGDGGDTHQRLGVVGHRCRAWSWTTSSPTAATSRCIPARPPSRSCRLGDHRDGQTGVLGLNTPIGCCGWLVRR